MQSAKSWALPLLAEFGQAALRGADFAEVMRLGARCAADGLRIGKAVIFGSAPNAEAVSDKIPDITFFAQASVGWDVELLRQVVVDGRGQLPADRLIRDGSPMCLIFNRETEGDSWPDFLESGGVSEVICASIGAGDTRYGVLEVGAEAIGHFTADDQAFMSALANLLAAAFLRFRENPGRERIGAARDIPSDEVPAIARSAVEIPIGIAVLDDEGTILQSNAFYNEYISGHVVAENHAPAKILSEIKDERATGETLLRLVGGKEIWVRLDVFPLFDHDRRQFGSCTIITDVTRTRFKRLAPNPDLPHRIRNILSVIRVIARRTAERSESVEDYAAQLESRISALARVQTGMIADPNAGVDFGMLVSEEMLAHSVKGDKVTARGPRVKLWSKAAETLALAIHELTENAIKYGALSAKSGRIDISWRVDSEANPSRLELEWCEFGVPVVASAPRRRGFGHELIERTLPYELAATTSIDFLPGGIRCAVTLPLARRPPSAEFHRGPLLWTESSLADAP
jgi:two-component sensor histidine kinase